MNYLDNTHRVKEHKGWFFPQYQTRAFLFFKKWVNYDVRLVDTQMGNMCLYDSPRLAVFDSEDNAMAFLKKAVAQGYDGTYYQDGMDETIIGLDLYWQWNHEL